MQVLVRIEVPDLAEQIRNARINYQKKNPDASITVIAGTVGMSATNWYAIERGLKTKAGKDRSIEESTLIMLSELLGCEFVY